MYLPTALISARKHLGCHYSLTKEGQREWQTPSYWSIILAIQGRNLKGGGGGSGGIFFKRERGGGGGGGEGGRGV